eukprot:SAG31_NODE_4935_length_2851_cov_2.089753_2_plen_211_part_00
MIGITLLELVDPEGNPPHSDVRPPAEVLRRIVKGPPPKLPLATASQCGPALAKLVEALLSKDPVARPSAAIARKDPWLRRCCDDCSDSQLGGIADTERLGAAAADLVQIMSSIDPISSRSRSVAVPAVPVDFPRMPSRLRGSMTAPEGGKHAHSRLAAVSAMDSYAEMRASVTDDSVNAALLGDRNQWSGVKLQSGRGRGQRRQCCCVLQ